MLPTVPAKMGRMRRSKKERYITIDIYVPRARWEGVSGIEIRKYLAACVEDAFRKMIGKLQRDITERDQRIQELADELFETNRGVIALHAELENRADYQRQAVELRTRLVAEMGHEVRTPLHSISAISGFLADHLDGVRVLGSRAHSSVISGHDVTLPAHQTGPVYFSPGP